MASRLTRDQRAILEQALRDLQRGLAHLAPAEPRGRHRNGEAGYNGLAIAAITSGAALPQVVLQRDDAERLS